MVLAGTRQCGAFDYVGAGASVSNAYDPEKYETLNRYASGVLDSIFVGHSVSAMISALAHLQGSDTFNTLIMAAPSSRYIDVGEYLGGFSAKDIKHLLASLNENPRAWSASVDPAIVCNPDRPESFTS